MIGQSHYIDVYGCRNAQKGITRPDAIVTVTPRPYIAGGKPQYNITFNVELTNGEPAELPPEVLALLVQNAAMACVNMCVADLMRGHADKKWKAALYNIYQDTGNMMRAGYHYPAVLVGVPNDDTGHFYLVRKHEFDTRCNNMDEDTMSNWVQLVCGKMGVIG